jgi:hypothetical protein
MQHYPRKCYAVIYILVEWEAFKLLKIVASLRNYGAMYCEQGSITIQLRNYQNLI